MPLKTRKPPAKAATIAENIHTHRKAAGLTQLDLAHAIGYTGPDAGSYICRLEAGQQPRLSTLRRIAKALGCELGALVGE